MSWSALEHIIPLKNNEAWPHKKQQHTYKARQHFSRSHLESILETVASSELQISENRLAESLFRKLWLSAFLLKLQIHFVSFEPIQNIC